MVVWPHGHGSPCPSSGRWHVHMLRPNHRNAPQRVIDLQRRWYSEGWRQTEFAEQTQQRRGRHAWKVSFSGHEVHPPVNTCRVVHMIQSHVIVRPQKRSHGLRCWIESCWIACAAVAKPQLGHAGSDHSLFWGPEKGCISAILTTTTLACYVMLWYGCDIAPASMGIDACRDLCEARELHLSAHARPRCMIILENDMICRAWGIIIVSPSRLAGLRQMCLR